MKIGIDCRLWNETGVGRYIRNLVLNLQKIDNRNEYILFILNKDKEKILKQVQNDKFKVVETNIKWHTINEQIRFPRILNKENLDLVHFPYFSVPIFYNRPFVITIHDLIMHHFSTGHASTLPGPIYNLKLLGYKFVLKQAAKKARKIIAVSNATKKEIVDHLKINPQKITVIYEGADDKISNPKSQISNPQLKTKKYFLYVGNAYPHKNLERLLQAFSVSCHPEPFDSLKGRLREGSRDSSNKSDLSQNDIGLLLVGREDYFYKRLRSKVKNMGLEKDVIFLQNVSDGELADLYRNAKALILPSLMEGFGLPALEAMANNCLVLASDILALHEVCGDVAIYFNPCDVDDLKEKIDDIINHDNDTYYYSDKKEKGLERVKLFSWQKMAKETLRVYNSLMLSNKIQ